MTTSGAEVYSVSLEVGQAKLHRDVERLGLQVRTGIHAGEIEIRGTTSSGQR